MKLVNNNILIRPLKKKVYTQLQTVLDEEKNEGKDPVKDEMETKKVEQEVEYEIQKAKVLHVSDDNGTIQPGSIVYYPSYAKTTEFRYLKNTLIIKPHDIIAID